jgi:site-specific recombinase XerD
LEIEKGRSKKTQNNYKRYLLEFLKFSKIKNLNELTEDKVRNFRIFLANKNIKKITQSYYLIALRNFLKFLIKRGYNVLSPDRIELPKVFRKQIEILEYAELERLLNAPKGDDLRTLRDKAILETLFSTGLRLSELCSLNRYINLERGEITILGKGGKLRVVFLSNRAKEAIKNYLSKRVDTNEALFISLTKSKNPKVIGRISGRAIERLIDFWARKAGIPHKVWPHQIRHSYATDLLINGADLRAVQELLGHQNISTTQVYTHLTNKELREIHKSFHARRRK